MQPDDAAVFDHLSSPARVREVLSELGLKPSKALGQNFLTDANILRILIETAQLRPSDQVLEIGPGLGVVTARLLRRVARVVAIEKDARLVGFLSRNLPGGEGLTLLCGDVLETDVDALLASGINKVVSNLPYSVGSRALVDLAASSQPPERIVVTVQEEVARRLAARPGNRDYGLLTVRVQVSYKARIAKRVSPTCFWPVPRVGSMIVELVRRRRFALSRETETMFRGLASVAFAHRRKQMGGILIRHGPVPGLSADAVKALLAGQGIDPAARPGELHVGKWVALANALTSRS